MRYLTVYADYRGTGIKDDFEGPVAPSSLDLPQQLIARVADWVRDDQAIILLEPNERCNHVKKIEELDKTGMTLARELKAHFGHSAKVQYYSEGKSQRMLP